MLTISYLSLGLPDLPVDQTPVVDSHTAEFQMFLGEQQKTTTTTTETMELVLETSEEQAPATPKPKFKITKKLKMQPEQEPEPSSSKKAEMFQVSLKKVKKKVVQNAQVVDEYVPLEELDELVPEMPAEIIQFFDTEESEMAEVAVEGLYMLLI